MSLLSRIAVEAARGFGLFAKKGGVSATYLVVAGGGGGGSNITTYNGGTGGGGAGGYQTSTFSLSTLNTYSIVVGAGGSGATAGTPAAGSNGANSVISGTGLTTVTSIGGGGGGKSGASGDEGVAGGSGGGAGASGTATVLGGAGTSGQGNNGGSSSSTLATYGAGGGGGAGAVGSNGSGNNGGNGGAGVASSISGSSVTYAGGGGGGTYGATAGTGGAGGGGNGSNSTGSSGTANLGGGGGGGGANIGGQSGGGSGGSGIVIISYPSSTPLFVGGTITTSGGNQIHTFTSSGTLSPITPITASYLVVAGGGGGGSYAGGGGGGAGGLLTNSTTLYSGATYVVTVGAGGVGGVNATPTATNGSNSVISGTGISTVTSIGGGYGAGYYGSFTTGASGGSGGGNAYNTTATGGAGTSGQGNAGGGGSGGGLTYNGAGGGGGASAVGGNSNTSSGAPSGNGGAGSASSISGSSVTYAGGGGGGNFTSTAGTGGSGGGGNGGSNASGSAGTVNLGGGGGGSGSTVGAGGAGGSGIVIISYAGSQVFNGGLVTTSGGNTIHTFTSTGALTPLTNNLNNSLRFRSSASAYLSRTPSVASNRRTWTLSMWIKRGSNFGSQSEFFTAGTSGTNYLTFQFDASNRLALVSEVPATVCSLRTTSVYRDPAAWYHITLSVDTTQATAANRVKLYVNGNQLSAFDTATYPSQNTDLLVNSAVAHYFSHNTSGGGYFDGYDSDIYFIDGQQLEPYYFGNNDANGVWKPIQYKGTYGTNGFYLTFGNTTSTTTLGYDTSPNGNNWTCNNISLTAGATYDAMLDVPTNTSATVANFPTLNPLSNGGATISNANLTTTANGATHYITNATFQMPTSGKYYWEITTTTLGSTARIATGLLPNGTALSGYPWGNANTYGWYYGDASNNIYWCSNTTQPFNIAGAVNDVLQICYDADNGTIYAGKNNVFYNSSGSTTGSPSTLTNPTSTGVTATNAYFPATSVFTAGAFAINFGQRPFSYTPPTGFVALNTYNLPTPTILQGNKYMDATLYAGNAVGLTAVNQGQFKPDLVWIKDRTQVAQHVLTDSVRGTSAQLFSSLTNAEQSNSTYVTSFNSNGFTVGVGNAGTGVVNNNGDNFVGWQWQAGQGSTSSNTSGSITSTVSVNTTAGFSVVTYTGTGANATVGHGLGVAPKMIIVKQRSGAGQNWAVYHASLANTGGLALNLTNATITASGWWNNTSPTSSVFSLGGSTGSDWFTTNQSGSTYVAYCWAEIAGFSKFGSYTGNGSTDGPFTYLGFRPKFVMIKNTTTAGYNWVILDSARDAYNYCHYELYPNSSAAETNASSLYQEDFLSNGFKIRQTDATWNASGSTYIYAAFAENPFKNSNAR